MKKSFAIIIATLAIASLNSCSDRLTCPSGQHAEPVLGPNGPTTKCVDDHTGCTNCGGPGGNGGGVLPLPGSLMVPFETAILLGDVKVHYTNGFRNDGTDTALTEPGSGRVDMTGNTCRAISIGVYIGSDNAGNALMFKTQGLVTNEMYHTIESLCNDNKFTQPSLITGQNGYYQVTKMNLANYLVLTVDYDFPNEFTKFVTMLGIGTDAFKVRMKGATNVLPDQNPSSWRSPSSRDKRPLDSGAAVWFDVVEASMGF